MSYIITMIIKKDSNSHICKNFFEWGLSTNRPGPKYSIIQMTTVPGYYQMLVLSGTLFEQILATPGISNCYPMILIRYS